MATVTLDTEFLKRVLYYMEHCDDESDYRESWKSKQLKKDINQMIDILGLPEDRKFKGV